jgi:hypothetical protein
MRAKEGTEMSSVDYSPPLLQPLAYIGRYDIALHTYSIAGLPRVPGSFFSCVTEHVQLWTGPTCMYIVKPVFPSLG